MAPSARFEIFGRATKGDWQYFATQGVTVRFSGLTALSAVDLRVGREEVLGLIGPNGAGKTTLVNVMSGFQRPNSGRIYLDGIDVTSSSPARLAHRGVIRTFQGVRLFASLTTAENVEVGALAAGLSRSRVRAMTEEILRFTGLWEVRQMPAGRLPYGYERRLAIARTLANSPSFLLLDEPGAGLDAEGVQWVREIVTALALKRGCGVLLVEHDMSIIMGVCDRVHVLVEGSTAFVGSPNEAQANPAVVSAYLGNPHTC
jgi:branched-chain amino acid transport system ATP-binding protein